MTGEAVVGPLTGRRLDRIPVTVTTWKEWREAHPETTVLKPPLPLAEYEKDPYALYRKTQRTFFPTGMLAMDRTYRPKDPVTIVWPDGKPRCFPHPALPEGTTEDGRIRIQRRGATVTVTDSEGRLLPSMTAYWFAWLTFYPQGTVWAPPAK